MKLRIYKCVKCTKYTLQEYCPQCKLKTISPHPPRFSPDDRYARYRLKSRYLKD